ncbi:hypothetical protein AVEN_194998-1 [Araneus ventricosus]|uniref:Uncharacterized protein n=1 Tax=Araneus ventricosus TaxID=182803 RepID=A0A4Y2HP18_ARAVE|nr:hypothetical protein AVEN_194998-1 [Araneus ventricosus]
MPETAPDAMPQFQRCQANSSKMPRTVRKCRANSSNDASANSSNDTRHFAPLRHEWITLEQQGSQLSHVNDGRPDASIKVIDPRWDLVIEWPSDMVPPRPIHRPSTGIQVDAVNHFEMGELTIMIYQGCCTMFRASLLQRPPAPKGCKAFP